MPKLHLDLKKVILLLVVVYLLSLLAILAIRALRSNVPFLSLKPSQPSLPLENGCLATKPISFKEIRGKLKNLDSKSVTIDETSYSLTSNADVYKIKSQPLSIIYDLDKLTKLSRTKINLTEVNPGDRVSGLDICNVEEDPQAEKGIYILYVFRN